MFMTISILKATDGIPFDHMCATFKGNVCKSEADVSDPVCVADWAVMASLECLCVAKSVSDEDWSASLANVLDVGVVDEESVAVHVDDLSETGPNVKHS